MKIIENSKVKEKLYNTMHTTNNKIVTINFL